MDTSPKPRIGLALGSGSARGMAHIGIIEELEALGIKPDIVCGSSIGSLVGAAYVLGKLTPLRDWVKELTTGDIVRYMDIRLAAGGGFAHGQSLVDHLVNSFGNPLLENLSPAFGAVATDLHTGREVWLQQGQVWQAVRASIALPGILTPVARDSLWLVDGGLVNPVPVSLCRAMGADIILAVNLNGDLVGRHTGGNMPETKAEPDEPTEDVEADFLDRISSNIKEKAQPLIDQWFNQDSKIPGVFDVMAASINIMQDRITRSRLAGEPADITFQPRLANLGLLEFDRSEEAISEGKDCVKRNLHNLEAVLQTNLKTSPVADAPNFPV